jgi:hypothetical protein
MGRPRSFKNYMVVSIRFEMEEYTNVQEIAQLESNNTGKKVSTQELIRDAVRYVYGDNERLRECFRRTREAAARRYK